MGDGLVNVEGFPLDSKVTGESSRYWAVPRIGLPEWYKTVREKGARDRGGVIESFQRFGVKRTEEGKYEPCVLEYENKHQLAGAWGVGGAADTLPEAILIAKAAQETFKRSVNEEDWNGRRFVDGKFVLNSDA